MTKTIQGFLLALAAAAVLCLAPSALADTASMTLTGPGSNGSAAGVYIGPYVATINTVSTPVICDDFADDSYIGESWTANVTTLANLTGTKWGGLTNASTLYDEAAWLTLQLLSTSNKSTDAAIQYAIWDLFDPAGVGNYLGTTSSLYNAAQGWIASAGTGASTLTQAQLAEILIYTPTACISGPCLTGGLPQEFIVVDPISTPEPATILLLGLGLGGLFLLKLRQRLSSFSS